MSKREFDQLVLRALDLLPPQFADFLDEVPVEVRDEPTSQQLHRLKMQRGGLLLGLYQGRPRTERSVEDSARLPDVIYIFQEPIQRISRNEADLVEQVRKTVLHEIGHHFGMAEKDLEELGYG